MNLHVKMWGRAQKLVSTSIKFALQRLENYCNPNWKWSCHLHFPNALEKLSNILGHLEVKDISDIYYSQLPLGNCIAKRKPYKRVKQMIFCFFLSLFVVNAKWLTSTHTKENAGKLYRRIQRENIASRPKSYAENALNA